MEATPETVIFIVGVGAPASLYTEYLDDLKKRLPQKKFFIVEWWNQQDFGIKQLQSFMGNSKVFLIAHSAGGVIALQALEKWPDQVKKIVFLDSHFLKNRNILPSINRVLEVMLTDDNAISRQVNHAYAPIVADDSSFNKALQFAINWGNDHFDQVSSKFNLMSPHSGLHIGFTNSSYQIMNNEDKKAHSEKWGKSNVDVMFFPFKHFDLIDKECAAKINQEIVKWLC